MKIVWKNRLPEANIQAEFYMRCKLAGIPILLEYKVKGARFDAVILDNDTITHIIEFKSMTPSGIARRLASPKKLKQIEKYERFGLPVILVVNLDGIDEAIVKIKGAA